MRVAIGLPSEKVEEDTFLRDVRYGSASDQQPTRNRALTRSQLAGAPGLRPSGQAKVSGGPPAAVNGGPHTLRGVWLRKEAVGLRQGKMAGGVEISPPMSGEIMVWTAGGVAFVGGP